MAGKLFEFWWDVLETYRIERRDVGTAGRSVEIPCLALGVRWPHNPSGQAPHRRYAPFVEEPALFRTFADLKPEPDAILAFALRYGHLGAGELASPAISFLDEEGVQEVLVGMEAPVERMDFWADEIRMMQDACIVWELVKRRAVKDLAALMWTDPTHSSGQVSFDSEVGPADRNPDGSRRSRLRTNTWVPRRERQGTVSLALSYLHALSGARVSGLRLQSVLDEGEERIQLKVIPSNLLEALWLQLAESMGASRDYHKCDREGCGRWFERAPQAKRRTALYCSPACRNKAWRDRKQAAFRQVADHESAAATKVKTNQRVSKPRQSSTNPRKG